MKTHLIVMFVLGAVFLALGQDGQRPQLVPRPNTAQPGTTQPDAAHPDNTHAAAPGQPAPSQTPSCTERENHLPPKVAWTVLPERVVRDNYGHHVSHNYLAIDVTVHNNNCSNQLVVKSFVFKKINDEDPDLTTDPDLVKGSIAKGHELGARNRVVSGIKTLGLIGTGASGYFKAVGASASFNRGLSIFSDPFEKGIELIFPDTTITYLKNWADNQVFKDGFTVAPHNETRGRVFLPIDYICQKIKADAKNCRPAHHGRGPVYNPAALKQALGNMQPFGFEAAISVSGPIASTAGGTE